MTDTATFVLVTGSRRMADTGDNWDRVSQVLPGVYFRHPGAILLHGDAPGLDAIASTIWTGHQLRALAFPADWYGPCRDTCKPGHRRVRGSREHHAATDPNLPTFCPAAGVYRNQDMVDKRPAEVHAWPIGRSVGTLDCIDRARRAGLTVEEH